MSAVRRIAAVAALMLLTACAGRPEPTPGTWHAQQASIAAIRYFTASGKIALRTTRQAESASLLWQQLGDASHLRLSGPMGLSATTVDSDGKQVVIRQGDETRHWDVDDPALHYSAAWNLPLHALQYWLKGVPDPELDIETLRLDPAGRLPLSLQQQGWLVEYQEFSEFEGFTLPTRLRVSRKDTSARIILRHWQDIRQS